MRLAREPTVPRGVMLLLIALALLWFSGRDFVAARRAYQAAPASPVADYVVDGQRQVEVGSGKGRHTEYFLRLALFEPQQGAPAATELRVASKVYQRARKGDHWRARIGGSGPVFDPELSGVEREKQVWRRVMALVLAVAGGVILAVALRRR